ncbi:unnamed protein product [Macrosiphum euphorbiae]|uniref:Uncharacterized protein n=1 Tax=Macrosiphum euphorbiae TaxID=13131 RepID=A0AAV0Y2U3_9HEMI|nr:unnamed protein product [Macrosiphum euphorbiae]
MPLTVRSILWRCSKRVAHGIVPVVVRRSGHLNAVDRNRCRRWTVRSISGDTLWELHTGSYRSSVGALERRGPESVSSSDRAINLWRCSMRVAHGIVPVVVRRSGHLNAVDRNRCRRWTVRSISGDTLWELHTGSCRS